MSPRRKQFDPAVALDSAMELFWAQGYEATSVADLVGAMGINRFSLYDTFGDKHELYLAACRRYEELIVERLQMFENAPSGLAAIRGFFDLMAKSAGTDAGRRGCLLVNSAVEKGIHDEAIGAWCRQAGGRMEDALRAALTRAADAGELREGADPRELAAFITTLIQGLVVSIKAGAGTAHVRSVARTALSVLTVT